MTCEDCDKDAPWVDIDNYYWCDEHRPSIVDRIEDGDEPPGIRSDSLPRLGNISNKYRFPPLPYGRF